LSTAPIGSHRVSVKSDEMANGTEVYIDGKPMPHVVGIRWGIGTLGDDGQYGPARMALDIEWPGLIAETTGTGRLTRGCGNG
jgi:hypothetical protein